MSERDLPTEEQEFTLDEILAEFASPRIPEGELVAPWDPDYPHPERPASPVKDQGAQAGKTQENKSKFRTEPKGKRESMPVRPESKARPEPRTKPEPNAKAETRTKAEPKSKPEPKAKAAPKPEKPVKSEKAAAPAAKPIRQTTQKKSTEEPRRHTESDSMDSRKAQTAESRKNAAAARKEEKKAGQPAREQTAVRKAAQTEPNRPDSGTRTKQAAEQTAARTRSQQENKRTASREKANSAGEPRTAEKTTSVKGEPRTAEKTASVKGEPKETSAGSAEEKVMSFPDKPSRLERLVHRANVFSSHMFEESASVAEQDLAEKLLPGVDEEEIPEERPIRRAPPRAKRVDVPPDLPPQELASRYGKGLKALGVRKVVVFLLALVLVLFSVVNSVSFSFPYQEEILALLPMLCAVVQLAAFILSYDLVADGFRHWGVRTILSVAAILSMLDGLSMHWLGTREGSLPYCLITTLALFAGLWGMQMEKRSLRLACRTAASAKEPYRVTLDSMRWNGQPCYTKWAGKIQGFGSQIQTPNGTQVLFRRLTPVLLLGCLVFSVISALICHQPKLLLWNLSATTCACGGLAAALAFPLPYQIISKRLASGNSALAGWEGISQRAKKSYILLGDHDIFPPGAVALNGVKIFPGYAIDRVASYTATLIRESNCGLERVFYEYLRSQGAIYRRAQSVAFSEGGIAGVIHTDHVLVGDAAYMRLQNIDLPQGLNVKNAVFCAINGTLAGIFALNYALHATVRPSVGALLSNHITPVLTTRDFNITPSMLTQRFKLPADRMAFPEQERRRELSGETLMHDESLICLVCREGIGPFTEAVVGGKRLFSASRLNTALAVAEAIIGLLLAFYLTAHGAFGSLSLLNLLIFHLAWLVPTLLISGWVNRY